MAFLRPFRALRPRPDQVSEVAAVPYDVVNREEAAALAQGHPSSFLHISRAEIDLPASTDPYSPHVYNAARTSFDRLVAEAMLTEEAPSLYAYRLRQGGHEQIGIAGTWSIDEYDRNLIKKHEFTRKDKEDDRTRHLMRIEAQTGPVFLTYRGRAEIDEAVRNACKEAPLYDFTAVDGVTHTLWTISRIESLVRQFAAIPALYIADGHHRAASASRVRAEMKAAHPNHTGQEAYNFVLAVAFPENQLRILPYHRVIKDLNGHTDLLMMLSESFEITSGTSSAPPKGAFAMYFEGRWHGLKPKEMPDPRDPIASLDVSILQDQVLTPVFGIHDPRTDKRIDFVGGIRGVKELERLVKSGKAQVAFALHPTSLPELLQVADTGQIMPPKSTWFEPKLRDGILSHWINAKGN